MKSKLPIHKVILTLMVSYGITSYINTEFNPLNLGVGVRMLQVMLTGFSLVAQYALNDINNNKH